SAPRGRCRGSPGVAGCRSLFSRAEAEKRLVDSMGAGGEGCGTIAGCDELQQMETAPMQRNDLNRSLVAFDQNSTLVAVVELSLQSWLVAGIVPGVKREPLKKLSADRERLLALLERWRNEAIKAGHAISRIAVAFEAGRDGF